jgi:hypothetical protein
MDGRTSHLESGIDSRISTNDEPRNTNNGGNVKGQLFPLNIQGLTGLT